MGGKTMKKTHKHCDECGNEHSVCKYCGGLVYESDTDEVENCYHEKCRREHYEKQDKDTRAKLRAQGKWTRLCSLCNRPLQKGKCAFMFTNMDGTMDQKSLSCNTCIEIEARDLEEL